MSFSQDESLVTEIKRHFRLCLAGRFTQALLLIWMEHPMEKKMDSLWRASPSLALAMHEHIIGLMTFHLRLYLPEIEAHSCAPLAHVPEDMHSDLVRIHLLNARTGLCARRYAVITHWPWRGGCGHCALASTCHRTEYGTNSHFAPCFLKDDG